jgi:hypothetical protein
VIRSLPVDRLTPESESNPLLCPAIPPHENFIVKYVPLRLDSWPILFEPEHPGHQTGVLRTRLLTESPITKDR